VLSHKVLGDSFPQDGSLLMKVDTRLILLVFSETDDHAGTS
jgi:hypothetical protein